MHVFPELIKMASVIVLYLGLGLSIYSQVYKTLLK